MGRRSALLSQFLVDLGEHVGPLGRLRLDQQLHGRAQLGQQRAVGRLAGARAWPPRGDARSRTPPTSGRSRRSCRRARGPASFRNWSLLQPRLSLSWRSLPWNVGVFCWLSVRSAPAASSTTASKSALLHCSSLRQRGPCRRKGQQQRRYAAKMPVRMPGSHRSAPPTHGLDGAGCKPRCVRLMGSGWVSEGEPNLLDLGNPRGANRPACARSPTQSFSSDIGQREGAARPDRASSGRRPA